MSRGDDSVSAVVEEDKHAMNIPIQTFMTGRCHARCFSHASYKGMNGPQLVVGILGKSNTRVFRRLTRGNVPTRVEAFPTLMFNAQHFLNPWTGYPWLRCAKQLIQWQTRERFYVWPFARQPVRSSVFKVLPNYSHRGGSKSGNTLEARA